MLLNEWNVVNMKETLQNRAEMKNLLAGASDGICSDLKVCLLLSRHKSIMGCDIYLRCVTKTMQLVLVYI